MSLAAFSGEQGETDESWQRSFQVDVMGYKKLLEATTPHLARREGLGSIVTISTMAAFEARYPIVGGSYPALKRAQAVLAKDFARKLSALGVRINTVAPAAIETPDAEMPDGAVELSTIHAYMSSAPGVRDKLVGEIPLGRIGRPDEVANVCLFLASPLSSFVHGATLMVDGGATLML
jgi:NAD(P)-dependent dehydrogenase (short-subunit alcohol dehydrogenase family)